MARESEARTGASHSFGIFVDGRFIGEANLSGIARGALQSGNIGYWIDMKEAGHGYVPEAVATIFRFAFEDLGLHRIQIPIVPRNQPSHRVVEKLELRLEGMAQRNSRSLGGSRPLRYHGRRVDREKTLLHG
jgi:ribosomal-protein-alanine N-acetyltransferase